MLHWIKIADKLPEEKKPVFLIKQEHDNVSESDIGYLVINEEGIKGWFIDNDFKVFKLHSRSAWMYLEEKTFFVPDVEDDKLESTVLDFLERLKFFDTKLTRLSFWMIKSGKGLYPLDYFISGIVSRSLSLIYGFETLLVSRNYVSAAHLVRPHLDNYMRLHAAWLVSNPHDFARRVWNGESIGKIRDRDNKLMKDWYLKEKVTQHHPWMEAVYNETSGFIHFSNKHIANATSVSSEEQMTLNTFIGKTDNNVSNTHKLEAIMCMIEITNCIVDAIFGWLDTKRIKG